MRRRNPAPRRARVALGTPDYYRFRNTDYLRRAGTMPFDQPPPYYLAFGARNLTTYLTETRPRLSTKGQEFIDRVAVRLQELLEELALQRPGFYSSMEEGRQESIEGRNEEFERLAFATHIRAYCESGWSELRPGDRAAIIADVPFSHWLASVRDGTALALNWECGRGWRDAVLSVYAQMGITEWATQFMRTVGWHQ
jgi:hypothetical protein